MERLAKIVNGWKSLTILAKRFILDVWQGSKYFSAQAYSQIGGALREL